MDQDTLIGLLIIEFLPEILKIFLYIALIIFIIDVFIGIPVMILQG